MKQQEKEILRMYVRTREDLQGIRKRTDNRLGMKADGSQQNLQDERQFPVEDFESFKELSNNVRKQEHDIEKKLKKKLKEISIYNEFLKDVKGCGEIASAWLISEIDIHKADTVSKIWQYAGLNPGLIRGKKRIKKDKYKSEHGEILQEIKNIDGGTDYLVLTNEMVRGDKATPGFVLPYNKNLKTVILGVIGKESFIRQQNYYAMEYYYPYKHRLENSDQITKEVQKGGKVVDIPWKDTTQNHKNLAAIRYMMKFFLIDLYAKWRALEGLHVREPYQEEKLGHKHSK